MGWYKLDAVARSCLSVEVKTFIVCMTCALPLQSHALGGLPVIFWRSKDALHLLYVDGSLV